MFTTSRNPALFRTHFHLCFAAVASLVFTLAVRPTQADELFPAHRVVGNVYYVGSKELATYLITTPAGHLLINSGFEETVPMIRVAVESLGFKLRDVKILLASHAHNDHVAGHALMKELTGAQVVVMRGDDQVIASGGEGQYLYTDHRWAASPVDRVLRDGELVELGGVSLTARRTPAHTRGCTTWTWRATEGDQTYDVVVIGSPNVNPGYRLVENRDYPEIADDFASTFRILKSLPCDVFLGAHGNYYGMIAKYESVQRKAPGNPFVDPSGYRDYVEQKEQAYRKTLAEQQAGSSVAEGSAAQSPVDQLRKLGAEVTQSQGIAISVTIKDVSGMGDADFQALGGLTGLKTLQLSGEGLNDRTLGFLTGLSALEDLSTNQAQFSDDGLQQLAKLMNLKQIKFFHTSLRSKTFTGAGLAHLATLKNLRRLTVAGCPFNDEGMAAVAKLTQLENFRTWHTYQTEAGNQQLSSLTNLRSLHLGQRLRRYDGSSNAWSLSDQSMPALIGIKSLDTLHLDESRLSFEALSQLKAMPNLKRLELNRIEMSTDDVERLKQTLPGVQIEWKPLTDEDHASLERLLKA